MIFCSESSSLVLPGYQSCLRSVEGEKYRIRVMRASPTLYESPRITHLEKRLKEKCTLTEKSEFVKKSGESFQLVCDAMALRDGKALFKRS